MNTILLISPDVIYKKVTGPAIRYLNFAIELSKKFNVVLYIPNKETDFNFTKYNFKVIYADRKELKATSTLSNVIIIQGMALKLYPFLKKIKKPLVVDLYDPIILENLELRKNMQLKERLNFHESDVNLILEQLAIGDYFICASEKQKDYWLGMLSAINRVNPLTYMDDNKMGKLIDVIPFGIQNDEPNKTKKVLKGVWPGINKDDKVIIWGGGIWDWFDPLTLIEAMKSVNDEREDIKLFFMGIGHPNMNNELDIATKCINVSKEYGLYNKSIFFNDWVEYEERQNFLLEADLGISTYFNNLETRFSFRTRVLDYLWCELPIVLSEGDYMAELISKNQIGVCVEEKDPKKLAETILEVMSKIDNYSTYKDNVKAIKQKYKWENIMEPLLEYCEAPYISPDKENKINIFYKESSIIKFKYYAIRIKRKLIRLMKGRKNEK